ncbi:MAG TPA: hypothetical protein VK894_04910, partial [Jiangellales bacterium]|nr:hypothetical protein [Jiangellales bacterium]
MTTAAGADTSARAPGPAEVSPPLVRHLPSCWWAPFVVAVGAAATGAAVARGPALGFAVAAVLLLGVAVLARPAVAVLVLPALPVLAGLRRDLPVPGLRLSELLAVGLAGVALVAVSRRHALPWTLLDWSALAYTLGLVLVPLSHTVASGGGTSGLLPLLGPLQFFLLYRAVAVLARRPDARALVLRVLLLSSLVTNLVALLQAADLPGVREQVISWTDVDAYLTPGYVAVPRATGLFPHWHVLAGFDVVVLTLCAALWLVADRRVLPAWGLAPVALLALAGITVSVTATSALGVVLAVVLTAALAGQVGRLLRVAVPAGVLAALAAWPLVIARAR